jgi:hypothetical protein
MAGSSLVYSPAALEEYVRSPSGPVFQFMMRGADRVVAAARNQIRLGHVRGGGAAALSHGSQVTHLNLRDTIVKRVISVGGLPVIKVGSDSDHALFVHDGTKPHIIRPKKPGGVLVFPGATAAGPNGLVFARIVHHPGTKPNRYLTDNLRLVFQ